LQFGFDHKRSVSCSAIRQRENGLFTSFDTPPIYERSAIDNCFQVLKPIASQLVHVFQFDCQETIFLAMNATHAVVWSIDTGHAINPGIYISTVEIGERENSLELVMKRIPVFDIRAIDSCQRD
jgi:hypothetical protein